MKNTPLLLILMLSLSVLVSPVNAERADRNKPMNFEADLMRYDDVKQVSVLTGNVLLSKGTIQIRGAQVEVRQDPDGYQFGLITAVPGKLAFFRQKREGIDEFIEGESELIEYDGRADTVKFVRQAQLRRLRGATLADEISGAVIVYENLTDTFRVDGSAAKGAPAATGGRVRGMLTPKPEVSPAAAPQSNASAPSPTALRATPTLGSVPK